MKQLSIAQLKSAVKELVVRLNKPIMIRGSFGVGKSQGICQAVDELDNPRVLRELLGTTEFTGTVMTEIRLSQYDSVEFRGFPQADKKTGTSIWYPPATMPFIGNDSFPDDKIIVMFFDEAPDAKADVFAVMQQLVLTRCVGEHMLKPNVRMLLAGNRQEDQSLAKKFPMPLNNRLIHFEAVNTVDEFCVYAQNQNVPPVFIAFWKFRSELVNTYDPKKVNPIVATNRTWFTAVELWQDERLSDDLKQAAIIGAVGEGPALEFMAYNEVWESLPSVEAILAKPTVYPVPDELSVKYATAMYVSTKMTAGNVDQLHTYLRRFPAAFVVMAWQLAVARDTLLFDTDAYLDFVKRYQEIYKS